MGDSSNRAFPDPDMEVLYRAGQTYTNQIYADPCCPSTRAVIGKVTPGIGAFVCVGGSYSASQCGTEVYNTDAQFCDSSGCTNHLMITRLAGTASSIPGDSGGVVYQRSGSSDAIAAGLIVAGGGPFYGYMVTWFHTVAQVEAQFGVTLVTTP